MPKLLSPEGGVGSTHTGQQLIVRTTGTDPALSVRVDGDTEDRFRVTADGSMSFGSGAAAPDALVVRSAAGHLTMPGYLTVGAPVAPVAGAAWRIGAGDAVGAERDLTGVAGSNAYMAFAMIPRVRLTGSGSNYPFAGYFRMELDLNGQLSTSSAYATANYAFMTGAGTLNRLVGSYGFASHNGAAVVNSVVGMRAGAQITSGGGTAVDGIGLEVMSGFRSGSSVLTNNYGIQVLTQTAGTNNYGIAVGAASTQTLWLNYNADPTTAAGGIGFGASRDTNLYRAGVGVLRTDGSLAIGATPALSGSVRLGNNEYIKARNAANTLDINVARIDALDRLRLGENTASVQLFTALESFAAITGDVVSATTALRAGASPATSGALRLTTHTAATGGIQFGDDTNLYRSAANTLKTDDDFLANTITSGWVNSTGSINATSHIAVGTSPAATGALRLPNNGYIRVRNAAGTADIAVIGTQTDDKVYIGTSSKGVVVNAASFTVYAPVASALRYYTPMAYSYYSGSTAIGATKITTPISRTSNRMFRIRVHGYLYGGQSSVDVTFVGFAYASGTAQDGQPGTVTNYSWMQDNGSDGLAKYIGIDDTDCVAIVLGDDLTSMGYMRRLNVDIWVDGVLDHSLWSHTLDITDANLGLTKHKVGPLSIRSHQQKIVYNRGTDQFDFLAGYTRIQSDLGLGASPTSTGALRLTAGTTEAEGIRFGTDTNLYRSAAHILKTNDNFEAVTVRAEDYLSAGATPATSGALRLTTHTATAGGIMFGDDTNLYRSAAGVLRTTGDLMVNRISMGGGAISGTAFMNVNVNAPNPTGSEYGGIFSRNVTLTSNNGQWVYGVRSISQLTSGTFSHTGALLGLQAAAVNAVAGASTSNLYGVNGYFQNGSTGTVTNGIGLYGQMMNSSTGTITNAYGLSVNLASNAGTITNTYGIYVGDVTAGTQANQAYSLYLSDANARNYIAGATTFAHDVTASASIIVNGTTLNAGNAAGLKIGGTFSSKLGFFDRTPVNRPELPSSYALGDVVDALVALGLINLEPIP